MDNNNENIGYGNPPKATRFAKGQSGNPHGRPKGSKNMLKLVAEILEQKISIIQDGKPFKISKRTAMFLQLINSAVKGNLKAISSVIAFIEKIDAQDEQAIRDNALSIDDEAFIQNFINEYIKEKKNGNN